MSSDLTTIDSVTGTVKGPGERPHEYLFITADNGRARIGEFVYYVARDADESRHILGNITSRRLVRNLPDAFLSDPQTPPSVVSSFIGLSADCGELYEITVETIGYFSSALGDFVNPRIPPNPGDAVFLATTPRRGGLGPRRQPSHQKRRRSARRALDQGRGLDAPGDTRLDRRGQVL